MFDRFTAQARQAITLARQEALRLQNGHIGTEHILLGLLAMEEGAATHALQSLGVDRARMRAAVDGLTEKGEVEKSPGQLPFTPRSKRALEQALAEALTLGHSYIGTEHLMLALVEERDGPAAFAIESVGAKREDFRRAILEACGKDPDEFPRPPENSHRDRYEVRGRSAEVIAHTFSRRKMRAPIVVAVALIAFAVWRSEWLALVGLPLVYLGWCGCAPNLNVADGFLPILLTGITVAVGTAVDSAGLLAAGAACGVTWVVASLESAWRCRPEESPAKDPAGADEQGEP